jgi:phosphoribosyl 1,2-cyclic phosphodiesterase
MDITFWGVRGSIATSGPSFDRYGGNTTCVEIRRDNHRLIIDAGTGIRALGDRLMHEMAETRTPIETTILFTHLHWDHIQGFPFFRPAFVPSTRLSLYGPGVGAGSLQETLQRQMQPPSFPVPLEAMGASMDFSTITDGAEIQVGPFEIQTKILCHPQGSFGYRVETGGASFCFATDVELGVDDEADAALEGLAKEADLLVHDAQYTEAQYQGDDGPCRRGWGHSTYTAAAEAARRCHARQLGLTHHDPEHDDHMVARIERDTRSLFASAFAAQQGQTVCL